MIALGTSVKRQQILKEFRHLLQPLRKSYECESEENVTFYGFYCIKCCDHLPAKFGDWVHYRRKAKVLYHDIEFSWCKGQNTKTQKLCYHKMKQVH